MHGQDDDSVEVGAARQLVAAAGGDAEVELRVLFGAGHRLRHDPRAIAVLVGWASRLGPEAQATISVGTPGVTGRRSWDGE